ncbi:MAG TPA: GSCFA domain-containing protein [Bacteroidales bacterium]|nr:GSCFA domain-containing protein [Bacteroidales bacterium]
MTDRFRTRVEIEPSVDKIGYDTRCLFMGSCFTENIGERMAALKFPVLLNPFGTLFNPVSVSDNLDLLIRGKHFNAGDLSVHHGLWFSFRHYTGFSHPDQHRCLSGINGALENAATWLKQCNYLVLTFGTSWVYLHNRSGTIVANCHKIPAAEFTRKLLSPPEIIEKLDACLQSIREFNPAIRVIFTVSPVRHWKDGAVNNQLSKSILHYSIHEVLKKHPQASYFPAYEIFMDELRDYRFYAGDMLHTSEQGVDYVWERFCDTWLDDTSRKTMAGVSAVLRAVAHRPSHTETTNHKKFVENTLKQINNLTVLYPFLDFSNEIAILQNKIS